MIRFLSFSICFAALASGAGESVGNRFAYLDENDPYYPDGNFPKLITPMWVGEPEAEAVICLTIDDMCRVFPEGERPTGVPTYARRPKVYYEFLKPVIDRLRSIDGRAPISVFSLQLDPDDKLVRHLQELGMSIECHTWTHPVPLLRAKEPPADPSVRLQLAIDDTLKSLANLSLLPGPDPVAQRNPGCDARNTASPRMFSEIFPLKTETGKFLRMDSSIFMAFTIPQPGMPRDWFFHEDGRKRFEKFVHGIPFTKNFRNYITDYPYPYVVNRTIWELPAIIPGDAHGVHAYGKQSEEIVEDWKRAVDIIVKMQGVYTLCFHPHGYIGSEQLVELVDYVDRIYGKRVKFLNCREIYDRLTHNLCKDVPLRDAKGADNHVRIADVNADGYLDVLLGTPETRIWNVAAGRFDSTTLPVWGFPGNVRLFTAAPDGRAGLAIAGENAFKTWTFDGNTWVAAQTIFPQAVRNLSAANPGNYRFRELNGDGASDLIVNHMAGNTVFLSNLVGKATRYGEANFSLPSPGMLMDENGKDSGLRFVDLDGDGDDDLVFSNEQEYGVWRFIDVETGWKPVRIGRAGDPGALPAIVESGRNNGAWFRSREMLQVNEMTAGEADHIRQISFEALLKSKP